MDMGSAHRRPPLCFPPKPLQVLCSPSPQRSSPAPEPRVLQGQYRCLQIDEDSSPPVDFISTTRQTAVSGDFSCWSLAACRARIMSQHVEPPSVEGGGLALPLARRVQTGSHTPAEGRRQDGVCGQ